MFKHIYVLLATLLFIGCGTVADGERHAVDVNSEIAIQEQIDKGEVILQQVEINAAMISQAQENLQEEEGNEATREVSETTGMEYTDLKGVFR